MKLFCLPFIFCFLLAGVSRIEAEVYRQDTDGLLTIGNESLEVSFSPEDGVIRRLVNKADSVDYCHQVVGQIGRMVNVEIGPRIGGVMVHDELRDVIFSDFDNASKISGWSVGEAADKITLTFRKEFEGAEFVLDYAFTLEDDNLDWRVTAVKTSGPDRSVKMVLVTPLPTWGYKCWAPIAEAPFESNPWEPFQINFGQADAGPVGNTNFRTTIPMTVFYQDQQKNALCLVTPFEIPVIRMRWRNNISVGADFHWNTRNYSLKERPHLEIISEYLGLRDDHPASAGLIITMQPVVWRKSLGWVYNRYREYFDPAPGFEKYDGVFVSGAGLMADSLSDADLDKIVSGRYDRGARWEEQHAHYPFYGKMIPDKDQKSWVCESHDSPAHTKTRKKMREHATRNKKLGVGTFVYYNTTEAEYWYAHDKYPGSIARTESGDTIPAWRAELYPDKRACFMINTDPATEAGKALADEARQMVEMYPDIAGFFWDVYGRGYSFDFAHDDGITMINNKPAYYPIFMFTRMMNECVGPLLHSQNKFITCNKPTVIQVCKGIDGIMARESTPREEKPAWLVAQSYLGLNRHVMILDHSNNKHPDLMFMNCLRYGYFYSDMDTVAVAGDDPQLVALKNKAAKAVEAYHPLIEKFAGKKWIFYPRALELPSMTDGNIFRLKDGSAMITMVSVWKVLNDQPGLSPMQKITCRLPDADKMTKFTLYQPDRRLQRDIQPVESEGDTLEFEIEEHGLTSVILLEK